jgi:hypothetical protein
VVVGAGAAVFGGPADGRQQMIESIQGRGYGAGRKALENRPGELDLLDPDLSGCATARFGQGHALRASVVRVTDAAQETAIFETRDVAAECAGGDAETFRKLAEPQAPVGQGTESCGLGDRHAAATHIRSFCEGKTPNQCANTPLQLSRLTIGVGVEVRLLSHRNIVVCYKLIYVNPTDSF